MGFLNNSGLAYFYSKLKEKFVRSVNKMTPDSNGNITIHTVDNADNLTSPDGPASLEAYIYRTSGGNVSIDTGDARLVYIEGNTNIVGRVKEIINPSINNNLKVNIDKILWRKNRITGNYVFNYTASTGTWSPSLLNTGITITGIHDSSVNASVSGGPTGISVVKATWETQITTTGIYFFVFSNNIWKFNNSNINLATYGITITGTPKENSIITIEYQSATPDSTLTVQYVKAEQGIIEVARPTRFESTGFNQFDMTSMIINGYTISNNIITSDPYKSICYCKAVGGVPNGYVIYSRTGSIINIGWCAGLPQESSPVVTANSTVTANLASITFENDGYVVVVIEGETDLCIHPRWSEWADNIYEEYVAPSSITLPTRGYLDNNNNSDVPLPLSSYGMPAINGVGDILNLEKGIYIQKIGHYAYTDINLQIVQEMGVDYDYDINNIFYILPSPITYTIENSNPNYIVNDFGTEEFIGTSVPVVAEQLYGANLRDKLRVDVELKKLIFEDVQINTTSFQSDTTYEDYPYKCTIPLSGVMNYMIPDVILNVVQATSGVFAPVSASYNGGIYIYASEMPATNFTIPVIICWRDEHYEES